MGRARILTVTLMLMLAAAACRLEPPQPPGGALTPPVAMPDTPPGTDTPRPGATPDRPRPVDPDPHSIPAADEQAPRIQLALLLDTSNSMDGLIDQARAQLWNIVNELARANRQGRTPRLEVALYEYGKSSLPAGEGYLRQVLPFTRDLDRLSSELFALTTNGGEEYCGWVLHSALDGLQWSRRKGDLKLVFIAGNEPFTQGPVNPEEACSTALQRGILVNTIFCGPYAEGEATGWKRGAALARGRYLNIDPDRQLAHIEAPQDAEILRLNRELNATYLAYGAAGAEGKALQVAMDRAASGLAEPVAVERAAAKASAQYKASWDLVDACESGRVKVEELAEEELPEEMRGMTASQRRAYVEEQLRKRRGIQERIRQLSEERDRYVAEKRREMAESGQDTLGEAMLRALREQATEKGYTFGE